MNIEISGHGVEVTPALREYVHEKLARVQRHFEQLMDIHVVMHLDKNAHCVEATMNASQKQFHAESEASDMYASIDLLSDKLDKQVRRYKSKITDHHRAAAHSLKAAN